MFVIAVNPRADGPPRAADPKSVHAIVDTSN